ncbi:hypothetical protein [Lactiplantibacillus herbarum]|uniref:hypothetical protein n=1 Tax=Lactiplantibacillus herbarum TaxID=1670446 RepID=UPI00064EDBBF|nr:hypothetical protein [Lactiplantibacillus herbarum]
MTETKKASAAKKTVVKYGKADLLRASGFTKLELDILKVALNDDQDYSVDQAKQAIKKFKEAI